MYEVLFAYRFHTLAKKQIGDQSRYYLFIESQQEHKKQILEQVQNVQQGPIAKLIRIIGYFSFQYQTAQPFLQFCKKETDPNALVSLAKQLLRIIQQNYECLLIQAVVVQKHRLFYIMPKNWKKSDSTFMFLTIEEFIKQTFGLLLCQSDNASKQQLEARLEYLATSLHPKRINDLRRIIEYIQFLQEQQKSKNQQLEKIQKQFQKQSAIKVCQQIKQAFAQNQQKQPVRVQQMIAPVSPAVQQQKQHTSKIHTTIKQKPSFQTKQKLYFTRSTIQPQTKPPIKFTSMINFQKIKESIILEQKLGQSIEHKSQIQTTVKQKQPFQTKQKLQFTRSTIQPQRKPPIKFTSMINFQTIVKSPTQVPIIQEQQESKVSEINTAPKLASSVAQKQSHYEIKLLSNLPAVIRQSVDQMQDLEYPSCLQTEELGLLCLEDYEEKRFSDTMKSLYKISKLEGRPGQQGLSQIKQQESGE